MPSSENAAIGPNEAIKVTKIETFVLKNSWVFVKISTDAGITGWGEMLKDDAKACAAGALEVANYLVGKDPRPVTHHWQAIHRGAFYRGGPIKTAILSGIDMALWDITGKCYGVPVYKLLGGPTRERIRVYGEVSEKTGVNAMKVGPHATRQAFKYVEGLKFVEEAAERFKALRDKHGSEVDIGVDFHGAVQPTTAILLMKALEPYHPWFYEEVVQALNVDVMAELAQKTHIPLATGERVFTKWGFREILEKRAATIIQPDICYAGGITELKIIAGMAEAYYTPMAPHNPQGPCSLAASLQIAASIPNFLIQERGDNEYAELLAKPLPPVVDGYRPLPTEPGLGITIDEDKLMAEVGDPHSYDTRFDPDDGSVVDW
ncbi:MAG: galactonate dehydratase [Candidatus Latescibacteria bacterium]|jgi:galactonate dehydratase|nr:galactonate dehydratase [Gemmatimonadaceae bacterium]MDP6016719.1 galactonate dehydratase [Candidatus Latescibacterota bacterium]MDP7450252.1 galactonate dehydratase [Candidatus Latescibacterota bacterium]HJP32941.1 galactonate dehydratase [Candidatus Latescibacterota bacterium]|tara:strand:+ start:506 stop:1633 length:1128 start_codon:yes stop_codon:yes gene_type:complete